MLKTLAIGFTLELFQMTQNESLGWLVNQPTYDLMSDQCTKANKLITAPLNNNLFDISTYPRLGHRAGK